MHPLKPWRIVRYLPEYLSFGARADAPGWVSAVEVLVVAVRVISEIPVAAEV